MVIAIQELTRVDELSADTARIADLVSQSVVLVRSGYGTGSGVVWNDNGIVVTNNHVVRGDRAGVILPNGSRLGARVILRAPGMDLAALEVESGFEDELIPASIGDSTRLRPGELIVAVGNPMGERNAVTLGMVSADGYRKPARPGEPILAAITLRPGNSGGALANVRGQVVGIPHMIVGNGLALAIPSRAVEWMLRDGRDFTLVAPVRGSWRDNGLH
jgi:serine protease Do